MAFTQRLMTWGSWEGADRDPRVLPDRVCDLCGAVGPCFTFRTTAGWAREALCLTCLARALTLLVDDDAAEGEIAEMARTLTMRVKGDSPAQSLSRWYMSFAGLHEPSRKVAHQMKTIIQRAGGRGEAERILRLHLSYRYRYRSQKPLEFVLARLDEYCRFLGLGGGS